MRYSENIIFDSRYINKINVLQSSIKINTYFSHPQYLIQASTNINSLKYSQNQGEKKKPSI